MLTGEKVLLGPVTGKDMPTLFQWRNNRELSNFSGRYRPVDEAAFTEWLAGAKFGFPRTLLIIRKKFGADALGYVELYNMDNTAMSAEFGIAIGDPANRGQGYGAEATRLTLGFCWRDLNLQRLALRVIGDNAPALHMYRKVGFETEGKLRRAAFVDGQYQDVTLMSVLRPAAL